VPRARSSPRSLRAGGRARLRKRVRRPRAAREASGIADRRRVVGWPFRKRVRRPRAARRGAGIAGRRRVVGRRGRPFRKRVRSPRFRRRCCRWKRTTGRRGGDRKRVRSPRPWERSAEPRRETGVRRRIRKRVRPPRAPRGMPRRWRRGRGRGRCHHRRRRGRKRVRPPRFWGRYRSHSRGTGLGRLRPRRGRQMCAARSVQSVGSPRVQCVRLRVLQEDSAQATPAAPCAAIARATHRR
jgi:hypothetical protein